MTMLDTEFRRVVSAYLERSRMKGRELAERALCDPGFIAGLKRGGSPQLDAADRMLRFMDIAPIGPRFRSEGEAFLIAARVRTRATALGTNAVGNSSFVRDLRNGASPTLDSIARMRSWMHEFAY